MRISINAQYRLIAFLLHVILFFALGLHKITPLRPQSVHQWRQCDGAAYALNYYQHNDNFFFPRTMSNLGYTGHTISEFPIIYFISGKLYRIFGFQEGIARMVSYLFFLVGLMGLFEVGLMLFKHRAWAFMPVLLLYASPFIPYYALNFLPNVPGFALSLASFYFLFKYWEKGEVRQFAWFAAISALAALLKPVEIFNFAIGIAILAAVRLNLLHAPVLREAIRSHQRSLIRYISIAIGVNILWIYYVSGYNDGFGNHSNLIGILPIWELNKDQILYIEELFENKWAYQLLWPLAYVAVFASTLAGFILKKHIHPLLYWLHIGAWATQIVYIILFFKTFDNHDYYMINIWVAPVLGVMAGIQGVSNWLKLRPLHEWLAFAVITLPLVAFPLRHSRFILQERYFGSLKEGINPNLQTITPYLRSIGIKEDDLVVSVPDQSPSVSLYLMNQRGWSEAATGPGYDLGYFRYMGAKYLVVNGPITAYVEWYQPYIQQPPIGVYKDIKIYKLF